MRWILTAIVSLAACSAPDRGPRYREYGNTEPRRGGTLTFSNYTNVRTLDPAIAYDENSTYCLHYLYDTLVSYPPGGVELVPQLAASWTISPDGLTYTFTLRDAKFSDGSPVRAADFAFAWKRVLRTADSPGPTKVSSSPFTTRRRSLGRVRLPFATQERRS